MRRALAIRDDLLAQTPSWVLLTSSLRRPVGAAATDVRLLDIVA